MTFSQNVSEQCISVEVYNDTTLELNESLTLSLSVSGVEDGVSISPQNVDVLVVNDDGKFYRDYFAGSHTCKLRWLSDLRTDCGL